MTSEKPLRLWPGVVVAVLLVLVRFVVPVVFPAAVPLGILGGVAGALLILLWWLFLSRAPWPERIGALVLMIAAYFIVRPLLHPSITGGMMGMMFAVYALPPVLAPALVFWAAVSRQFPARLRYASLVLIVLLGAGAWTLIRTDGVLGEGGAQLTWRWTLTPEEKLLAQGTDEVVAAPAAPPAPVIEPKAEPKVETPVATAAPAEKTAAPVTPKPPDPVRAEWPGFRGPGRDGVVRGVTINTDWSTSPPVEMWRRPIGPGWSSFAIAGDLIYTQEQRGEDETVACYRLSTGQPVWRHRDSVRFWESNAGAGPRGTPTLSDGRIYAFGATGLLNALDANTGSKIWTRNVASETGRKVPDWGFSSSPVIVDGVVVVAASGTLAGYDAATGEKRWVGPRLLGSYSSPHVARIGGVTQVLMLTGSGAASVAPATGEVLWEHKWEAGGPPIVQPALTPDGNVLINGLAMAGGAGIRRIAATNDGGGWQVQEGWTSNGLKPYFNDFVVHKGHAYGFDGSILASINLEDGVRKWKGGRYGQGQLVLLAEQDLLLVLSEEGELALVSATPDKYTELATFKAIEGKTWNHPALAGNVLLVRNGEEMAAFRLPKR